jgi:hypothetical protein
MGQMPGTKALKIWRGDYDFAVDGGGTGTITLRSQDGPIPLGAVIMGGYLDILTACLSATGTMALNSEGAADLLAATAQAGLTLGRKSIVPAFTGATMVKTTADRNVALVIATAAFTAGKFSLVLVYE